MLAPQYAVTAPPTDRVEIVVLRVALAAESCIRVPASQASVAVSIPCALGPPDLRFNQCRHFVYPCPCVEAARKILSAGTASASVNPRQVHVACGGCQLNRQVSAVIVSSGADFLMVWLLQDVEK